MSRTKRTPPATVGSAGRTPDRETTVRARPAGSDPTRESARGIYRLLGMRGLRANEAGNLTAYLHGLSPVERGWTIGEIQRLLFLRYLVEQGRLGS